MGKKAIKRKRKKETMKAKPSLKPTTAKYSIDQLLDKTQELIDEFNFPLAQQFCQRALELDGDNVRALETSGMLLLELGNNDAAKQCFGRAIEVQPDTGHSKYMYMGQLMTGIHSIQCYQKGIELMKKYMEDLQQQAAAVVDAEITKEDVSSAYCCMAEIYLTDECFGDDAEMQCKDCLDKAITEDSDNPEAHHLFASYWLSKDELQKAKECMDKGVSLWFPQWKELVEKSDAEELDPVQSCTLGYPARVNASKILIELKEYDLAAEVLELLLDEDDEVVESWYLLGWLHYLQGSDYYTNARFYLHKAQKVAVKVQSTDTGMVKHTEELLAELGPGEENEEDEDEANGEMEVTSDIESDDDDAAATEEMDH